MIETKSLDYSLQHFLTEFNTKDKFLFEVFCSEKAKHQNSPSKIQELKFDKLKTSQNTTQINGDIDSIVDSQKYKTKPNFKLLLMIVAPKLGFNVAAKGTNFIIDSILYLYNNNIDTFDMNMLYELLSKKHKREIKNIQTNINNSMRTMRRFSRKSILQTFFPEYDGRSPYAKYIIALSVHGLRVHFPPKDYSHERIEAILNSII